MESCGYKPCATAYHPTLSTPPPSPIESTVTRMHKVNPPPSMATTEIHGVDAVSRLLVHPSVGRGRKRNTEFEGEEGYCGRRETNPWERAVYKLYPRLLRPRERFFEETFEHVASLLVFGRAHRYDSPESARSGSFDLAKGGIGYDCHAILHVEIIKLWTWYENE